MRRRYNSIINRASEHSPPGRMTAKEALTMYTEKKDKVAAVFSYLGWVFWVIAFIIRNKDDALSRRHLNQGLLLAIAETITGLMTRFHGLIGFAGGILSLGIVILSIMGIVQALKERYEPLPIVGDIALI